MGWNGPCVIHCSRLHFLCKNKRATGSMTINLELDSSSIWFTLEPLFEKYYNTNVIYVTYYNNSLLE